MSEATELARLESERVERETAEAAAPAAESDVEPGADEPLEDDDDPGDPEPGDGHDTGEPAVEVPTGEPSNAQLRKLDSEQARHEEAIHAIMGAYVHGFGTCDKCNGIGLVPPGPTPKGHAYFKACAVCNGYGQVLTGSLREGHDSRDCPTCAGRGYVEALDGSGSPLANRREPLIPAAPLEPAGNGATATSPAPTAEPQFGAPAWMGDPSLTPAG